MQLTIRHETHYAYSAPLAYTIQQLHLTPRIEPQQRALSWQISTPGRCHAYTDAYGNTVTESQPEEKAPRRRPGPGAYGNRGMQEHDRPLPDPTPKDTTPAWSFN